MTLATTTGTAHAVGDRQHQLLQIRQHPSLEFRAAIGFTLVHDHPQRRVGVFQRLGLGGGSGQRSL